MSNSIYKCINCNEGLFEQNNGLACKNGHTYNFLKENKIPIFDFDKSMNEYTLDIKEVGERYDNSMKWVLETFKTSEDELRTSLIKRLNLKKGDIVLVTGAGVGDDLPYIAEKVGKEGTIYAQDFSKQMIEEAQKRVDSNENLKDYEIIFSVSDAINLPFNDSSFDAVYHFGGINLFPDIKKGISEMNRVAKENAMVVFGDETVAPWLKETEHGKMIIVNNPLCDFNAPLEDLPVTARDVVISWECSYYFYVVSFRKSDKKLDVNYDVFHKGLRGGTLKSRYYGQIEGIDLELKDQIYKLANNKGISRVEFIEELLKQGLKNV